MNYRHNIYFKYKHHFQNVLKNICKKKFNIKKKLMKKFYEF